MNRALSRACSTLVAVAMFLVLAGTASAANEPEFTYPTGTRLSAKPESPTALLGTSVSSIGLTQSAGTSTGFCHGLGITALLEQNTGSSIEAKITSATFGTCTTYEGPTFNIGTTEGHGTPWCLRSTKLMTEDQFEIRGGACSVAPTSITLKMGNCTYNRSERMTGTFKTDTGQTQEAILSLANIEFVKEDVFCFGPTSTILDGISLTMELDTTTFADPIYLS